MSGFDPMVPQYLQIEQTSQDYDIHLKGNNQLHRPLPIHEGFG